MHLGECTEEKEHLLERRPENKSIKEHCGQEKAQTRGNMRAQARAQMRALGEKNGNGNHAHRGHSA